MTIAFLNRVRGTGGARAFDADVLSWRDAVVANGGSVSLARLIIVDQFVFSEKAAGSWALTDDYWGFWAENEIQALTSLKQRRLATAVNSPTFTPDRDYMSNGTTNYIDSGFVPSTSGINCTGTNQRVGVYERTNVGTSNTFSAAVTDATSSALALNSRNAANNYVIRANSASFTVANTSADSRGLKAISRAGGTTVRVFDRGVAQANGTAVSPGSSAPTRAMYMSANNNAGTPDSFRAAAVGFAVVGGPLSDAQEAAQYASVQAWATSVGANV